MSRANRLTISLSPEHKTVSMHLRGTGDSGGGWEILTTNEARNLGNQLLHYAAFLDGAALPQTQAQQAEKGQA